MRSKRVTSIAFSNLKEITIELFKNSEHILSLDREFSSFLSFELDNKRPAELSSAEEDKFEVVVLVDKEPGISVLSAIAVAIVGIVSVVVVAAAVVVVDDDGDDDDVSVVVSDTVEVETEVVEVEFVVLDREKVAAVGNAIKLKMISNIINKL